MSSLRKGSVEATRTFWNRIINHRHLWNLTTNYARDYCAIGGDHWYCTSHTIQ